MKGTIVSYGYGPYGSQPASQGPVTNAHGTARRPWWKRKRTLLPAGALCLAVLVSAMHGSGDSGAVASVPSATGQATASVATATVSAMEFAEEFDANQVAAEKKYSGKHVQMTAKITNITDGKVAFADISTKNMFTQISCDLVNDEQALAVTNGQKVTFTGIVDGQMMGVITIKKCVILTP